MGTSPCSFNSHMHHAVYFPVRSSETQSCHTNVPHRKSVKGVRKGSFLKLLVVKMIDGHSTQYITPRTQEFTMHRLSPSAFYCCMTLACADVCQSFFFLTSSSAWDRAPEDSQWQWDVWESELFLLSCFYSRKLLTSCELLMILCDLINVLFL